MKVVVTDYWSGTHRPYQGSLHDPTTDEDLDVFDVLKHLIKEAGVVCGDEVEVVFKKTGRRPFGNRKVRRTAAHTYKREA